MTVHCDKFGLPIRVGDAVYFPSSGKHEEGTVKELCTKPFIECVIITKSGYRKRKSCRALINKTIVTEMMRNIYPELCI